MTKKPAKRKPTARHASTYRSARRTAAHVAGAIRDWHVFPRTSSNEQTKVIYAKDGSGHKTIRGTGTISVIVPDLPPKVRQPKRQKAA